MSDDSTPLPLVLHLARTTDAGDPYSFPFGKGRYGAFAYLRTRADGTSADAELAWDEGIFSDLLGLRGPSPDPARLPGLGGRLRRFLVPLGWETDARALEEPRRAVHLTLELGAAELFALPWEAIELPSGARLGKLPRCLLRYAWPGSATAKRAPDPPPEDGRILVAWSAGGRGVPHDEHLAAIRRAYQEGDHPDADRHVVELPDASLRALGQALAARAPVHVLHLVCHGGAVASSHTVYGPVLRTSDGTEYEAVDPERLADALRPHAGTLRLVVLAACQGGNAGAIESRLGSVALALHRLGVPAVIASRHPLSWEGSIRLAESLYRTLLVELGSLEDAFLSARARLVELAGDENDVDWASIQLYARASDGPDQRPMVFRPYRGLLTFQEEHARYFHGRQREIAEAVSDLDALVEARTRPRFLVVVGASGTGKSSIVLAGVVPALRARDRRWVVPPALRPTPGWRAAVEQALATRGEPSHPLLLVVDQLEEIFTVLPDNAERQAFVRRLWELGRDPASGVSVMATLRVDFLGRCGEIDLGGDLYLERVVYDEAHRVFVQRMAKGELCAAIEEPAAAVGLALSEGLVSRMLDDAGDEPGALPLCEYTLDELWKSREGCVLSSADYDRLGGVAGALVERAGAILDGLDETRRRAARRLLVQLVDTRGDAALDTRRRVDRGELRRGPAREAAVFDEVLDTLSRERLVVVSGEGAVSTVEIAHEQLIRSLGALRAWVAEDRAMLVEMAQLSTWALEAKAYDQVLDGKKLAYARVVLSKYEPEIEPGARQLIARSEAAEARGRTRARAGQALLVLVAVVMAVLAIVARQKQVEAVDASLLAGARELLSKDWPGAATRLLLEVKDKRAEGYTQTALDVLSTAVPEMTLYGHRAPVFDAAWSPDGRRVLTMSDDGIARVWDLAAPDQVREIEVESFGHLWDPGGRLAHAWSPDGKRIATVARNRHTHQGEVDVWEVGGTGAPLAKKLGGDAISVAWISDGKRLAVRFGDLSVRVWDTVSGDVTTLAGSPSLLDTRTPPAGTPPGLYATAFDTRGTRVASACGAKTVCVWDVDAPSGPIELKGSAEWIRIAVISPDGKTVVTSDDLSTARVWDLDALGKSVHFKGSQNGISSAAISPDGRLLVIGSSDGTSHVWDLAKKTGEWTLTGHTKAVTHVGWSPDGKLLVTGSADGTARVWHHRDTYRSVELGGDGGQVSAVAVSPDGKRVLTASSEGMSARVWDVDRSRFLFELDGPLRAVMSAAWSADGGRMVAVFADSTAGVWELEGTGEGLRRRWRKDGVHRAALSQDGKRVATTSADHGVRLWDVDGDGPPVELDARSKGGDCVALSPDGKRVATCSGASAYVWELGGKGEPVQLDGHQAPPDWAAFSPDGKRLVTASVDRTVRVWTLDGSAPPIVLDADHTLVHSAIFSPDGKRVVASTFEGTARVWTLDGSAPPVVIVVPGRVLYFASWSPEGERVITGSSDGVARVWARDGSRTLLELKASATDVVFARWSSDGERILTVSRDGLAGVWPVSAPVLEGLLRGATTDCLRPEMNHVYLGEPMPRARALYEACERSYHRTPFYPAATRIDP